MDTELIRLVPLSGGLAGASAVVFSVEIPAAEEEGWIAIGIVVFELTGMEATSAVLCCDEALTQELELDPNNREMLAGTLREILTNAALHLTWSFGASIVPQCAGIGTFVRPPLAVQWSYDSANLAFVVSP